MQYVVDIRQGSIRHVVSGILAVAPLSPPSSPTITEQRTAAGDYSNKCIAQKGGGVCLPMPEFFGPFSPSKCP